MGNKPELVGRFYSLADYDRAKALLTSAGFHTSSDNETALHVRPYLTMALGGARLFVPSDEVERARQLIEKHQPKVVELNYAHRVRRSMLAGGLALVAGVLTGTVVGMRQHKLESGVGIGLIAAFVWFLILSHIFVPQAKLKQK